MKVITEVKLANKGKFILAALDEGDVANYLVFRDLGAVNGDSVAREKLAALALAGSEAGLN